MVQSKKEKRNPVSVCSVTGKLKTITKTESKKTRDGCISFDHKYLNAAARAGLGSNDGKILENSST